MKNKIINHLLTIKAIQINTIDLFTWASKIKSPIYIDNRLIMSFPKIRNDIAKELSKLIKQNFKNVDFLIGVATSAITHCAYVSNILKLPMGYVRSINKDHGKLKDIEGDLSKANNIVIIEDLFSTGNSVKKAYESLKNNGYNIIGIVSIFSYDLNILQKTLKNIKYKSLISINDLISFTLQENKLSKNDVKIISDFIHKLNNK